MSGGTDDLSEIPDGTVIAAEYVLGLLDDAARQAAEARMAVDRAFAAEVAAWWDRLAPLVEAIRELPAPAGLWPRIEAAVAPRPGSAAQSAAPAPAGERRPSGDRRDAAAPRRRGAGGLIAAALVGAIAASAATVAVFAWRGIDPQVLLSPQAGPDAPLLTAAVSPPEGGEALYVAVYDPGRGQVVVAPSRILPEADDRSRQLWLIPADGRPRSAGLLQRGSGASAIALPANLRQLAAEGASIAVSSEPLGGSPDGQPTTVLGAGALTRAG